MKSNGNGTCTRCGATFRDCSSYRACNDNLARKAAAKFARKHNHTKFYMAMVSMYGGQPTRENQNV